MASIAATLGRCKTFLWCGPSSGCKRFLPCLRILTIKLHLLRLHGCSMLCSSIKALTFVFWLVPLRCLLARFTHYLLLVYTVLFSFSDFNLWFYWGIVWFFVFQSGLSGSSGIVCAALNCFLDFYKVRHLIKVEVRPNLILAAEEELGIVAGLQDRVAQVYGGLVYMV